MNHITFVDEVYNLFNNAEDKYCGGFRRARLKVQLALKRYIPEDIVKSVFDSLLDKKIIIKSKKKEYSKERIGEVDFGGAMASVYVKNPDIDNVQEILNSIYPDFEYFDVDKSEVVTKTDIDRLKALEKEKGIYIVRDYSDKNILYDISRKEILEYISILENYDLLFYKCVDLIKRVIKVEKKIRYEIYSLEPFCNTMLVGTYECNCICDEDDNEEISYKSKQLVLKYCGINSNTDFSSHCTDYDKLLETYNKDELVSYAQFNIKEKEKVKVEIYLLNKYMPFIKISNNSCTYIKFEIPGNFYKDVDYIKLKYE